MDTLGVRPDYVNVMGLRLVMGRDFETVRREDVREVLIDHVLARQFFPGGNPIGATIPFNNTSLTIVGVSTTVRQREIQGSDPDPAVYVPYFAGPNMGRTVAVIVRTSGDAAAAIPLIRQAVLALDSDIPVFNVRTMDELLAQRRWQYQLFGGMFAIFAGIALLLAAVGLYAVMAYSVTQRTQEIGVRMVLGAPPGDVVWLFLRRALVLVAIGLTIGMSGALGVGRLLQSILVQSTGGDVPVLLSIALLMIAVAFTACMWPARRATRLNPVAALRYE